MNIRRFRLPHWPLAALGLAAIAVAHGQVVPTTPSKFTTRTIGGGGGNGSATVGLAPAPSQAKIVRTVTYIALGESRQWKSTDGKTLVGRLIAFEDLVVESKIEGNAKPTPAAPPPMPEKPTVVREGKARLLVDNKPYEVPLDRLVEEDRQVISSVRDAAAGKKAATAGKN